jgi:hypothetical protein
MKRFSPDLLGFKGWSVKYARLIPQPVLGKHGATYGSDGVDQ